MNSWKGSSRSPSQSHFSSIWKYGWHPAFSSFFTRALAAASPAAADIDLISQYVEARSHRIAAICCIMGLTPRISEDKNQKTAAGLMPLERQRQLWDLCHEGLTEHA